MSRYRQVRECGVSRDMQGVFWAQCLTSYLTHKDTAAHEERQKSSSQNVEGLHGRPTNASDAILQAMRCRGRGGHDQNTFLGSLGGACGEPWAAAGQCGESSTQRKKSCPGWRGWEGVGVGWKGRLHPGTELRHSGIMRCPLGTPRNAFL